MGFRKDAYATVWETTEVSPRVTKARISTNGRKNRETGEYEQDFGGYVVFVGNDTAPKAAKLRRGDRIKLGDVDVTNKYDREKNVNYTNLTVYEFELLEKKGPKPEEAAAEGADNDAEGDGFPF